MLSADWRAGSWALAAAGLFMYLSFGPTFAIVQNSVAAHRRATATAVIYILLTVVGLGCGPLFTGWLIDRLADFDFRHPDLPSVVDPLRHFGAAASDHAAYGPNCLDRPPAGVAARCHAALALASRQGIGLTVLLYLWSALHYLAAAAHLRRGPGASGEDAAD